MISPFKISCNRVYTTIGIAIYTVVQTIAHLVTLSYMAWWKNCSFGDRRNTFLLFFFGNANCSNETYFDFKKADIDDHVVATLDSIILGYFILDIIWLITAVGLLMGACCRLTDIWALIFYLPWAAVNFVILVFDLFSAIFFSLNLPNYGSFFYLMGITDTVNDVSVNEDTLPDFVLGVLAAIMAMISSRGGVLWIVNLVLLIIILKITYDEYRVKPNPENSERNIPKRSNSERIRNWYMFYNKREGNADDCEAQNMEMDYVKQPVKVKMTGTLTIISYQTFNARNSSGDDGSSQELKPQGFTEDFPTIIVTDITSNVSSPCESEPEDVPWSGEETDATNKWLEDSETNRYEETSFINSKDAMVEAAVEEFDDIPTIVVHDIKNKAAAPSSDDEIDKMLDDAETHNRCQKVSIANSKKNLLKGIRNLEEFHQIPTIIIHDIKTAASPTPSSYKKADAMNTWLEGANANGTNHCKEICPININNRRKVINFPTIILSDASSPGKIPPFGGINAINGLNGQHREVSVINRRNGTFKEFNLPTIIITNIRNGVMQWSCRSDGFKSLNRSENNREVSLVYSWNRTDFFSRIIITAIANKTCSARNIWVNQRGINEENQHHGAIVIVASLKRFNGKFSGTIINKQDEVLSRRPHKWRDVSLLPKIFSSLIIRDIASDAFASSHPQPSRVACFCINDDVVKKWSDNAETDDDNECRRIRIISAKSAPSLVITELEDNVSKA